MDDEPKIDQERMNQWKKNILPNASAARTFGIQSTTMLDSFRENVKITEDGFGVEINCKLGLWGVSAPSMEQAMREAQRYYLQYYQDGEYGGI